MNPISKLRGWQRIHKSMKRNAYVYRKELVDEVESDIASMRLANTLCILFPVKPKCDENEDSYPKDKVHVILSRAIRDVLWLGWLSEAKARRGAYDKDSVKYLRDTVLTAFETGREYAKERP